MTLCHSALTHLTTALFATSRSINEAAALPLLGLAEADSANPEQTSDAVKRRLAAAGGWLLVFDNADSPQMIKPYIPVGHAGHILLTSRSHDFRALGLANPVQVPAWGAVEALSFILRSTNRDAGDEAEKTAAAALASDLGYLPLAIEQAAAYIAENGSEIGAYLRSYRRRRLALLNMQSPTAGDYKHSVATTWDLNFQAVRNNSAASAELLYLCAFLAPDRIPIEILTLGASHLGNELEAALDGADEDELVIDDLLAPVTKYSLIYRDRKAKTFDVHRMVQEVIRGNLDEDEQALWRNRAATAVAAAFPAPEFKQWKQCERLVPHAHVCSVGLTEDVGQHGIRLLERSAEYLFKRAQYSDAEQLYQQAIKLRQCLPEDNSGLAGCQNKLANVFYRQGRDEEARELYRSACKLFEDSEGKDSIFVAKCLSNLGMICFRMGRLNEAEAFHKRALGIRQSRLGSGDPENAISHTNLGNLYLKSGRLEEAEAALKSALDIDIGAHGRQHPDAAVGYINLGDLYVATSRTEDADKAYSEALAICESVLGDEHAFTICALKGLAEMKGRDRTTAAKLLKRAIHASRKVFGDEHAETRLLHDLLNQLGAESDPQAVVAVQTEPDPAAIG